MNSSTLEFNYNSGNNTDPGKDSDPSEVNALFAKDVVGFALHYYDNDYAAISGETPHATVNSGSDAAANSYDLFNGNIRYMQTSIMNPTTHAAMPMLNAYRYDQLNRLSESRSYKEGNLSGNSWNPGSYSKEYYNGFTYDAMGNIQTQVRHKGDGTEIENLFYHYQRDTDWKLVRNRLYHVNDGISAGVDSTDIDDMGTFYDAPNQINVDNNYVYDALGRLVKDKAEEIDSIIWTTTNKVKEIHRTSGSSKKNIIFDYDAMGHRIAKHIYNNTSWVLEKSTYYILDAQGNQLSMYEFKPGVTKGSFKYYLTERNTYGSQRLGTLTDTINMALPTVLPSYGWAGNRNYELTNHLGNVLTTISDLVYPISSGGTDVDYYQVGINQVTDYSPFGVQLDDRTITAGITGGNSYRYGFNSMEKDDEVSGEGNSYTAEFWQYDSRLGRRWDIDPIIKEHESPYACFANNPIWIVDPNGADSSLYDKVTGKLIATGTTEKDDKTAIWVVDTDRKGYDPKKPWQFAERLRYTIGKNQKKNIGKKNLRENHPLAGKGWKYKDQVYVEDLLNMTAEFNKLLTSEKSVFRKQGKIYEKSTDLAKMDGFRKLVETNGPYDLKSQSRKNLSKIPSYAAVCIGQYSLYNGRLMSNDDYGNFSYGYWGKSFGYDSETLTKAASTAQYLDTGEGDPPRDTFMVMLGFSMNK